jgi:hypothetical protein
VPNQIITLKKATAYFLLFIFSMVFTYETINCFSKKLNSFFVEELSDLETEKYTSEADETDNEKKDKIEDFYIDSDYYSIALFTTIFLSSTNCFVFTSAYSNVVYSPPEATIV